MTKPHPIVTIGCSCSANNKNTLQNITCKVFFISHYTSLEKFCKSSSSILA